MDNFCYLSLYIALWIISFIVYKKNSPSFGASLGGYFIVYYGISACAALWMSQQVFYTQSALYRYDIPSFLPLFYLFVVLLLFATPLFLFRIDCKNKVVLVGDTSNFSCFHGRIFVILCAIFCFVSVVVVITVLPKILSLDAITSVDAGTLDKRAFQQENNSIIFSSKFSTYSYLLWKMLKDIMICFSFFLYCREKNKLALLLIIFSCILPILWGLANANRQQALCTMISIGVTFLIFKSALPRKTAKKFILSVSIVVPVLFLAIILISFARFGDYSSFLIYELVRYFGESPLNFSSMLFEHQQAMLWGASSFPMFLDISLDERLVLIRHSVGIVSYIFYGFVGNFVMDFGKILTVLAGLFVLLVSLMRKHNNQIKNRLTIGDAIFIQFWANLCFQGLFFFTYLLDLYALVASLFISLLFKVKVSRI